MLFTSYAFLLFFPAVTVAYFVLPHRVRWVLLALASYYFYAAWKPEYALIILASTSIDFVSAQLMEREDRAPIRKLLLASSLLANFGLLFTFKYFNFFSESVAWGFKALGSPVSASSLNLLLPVGISFYTFQSVTYTVAVYRRQIRAERNFGIFAAYV